MQEEAGVGRSDSRTAAHISIIGGRCRLHRFHFNRRDSSMSSSLSEPVSSRGSSSVDEWPCVLPTGLGALRPGRRRSTATPRPPSSSPQSHSSASLVSSPSSSEDDAAHPKPPEACIRAREGPGQLQRQEARGLRWLAARCLVSAFSLPPPGGRVCDCATE